jgi:hypothetical protein
MSEPRDATVAEAQETGARYAGLPFPGRNGALGGWPRRTMSPP